MEQFKYYVLSGLVILQLVLRGWSYGMNEEPDTGPIFMLEPPSNLLVYSHIGKMIVCSAHGKPEPTMGWERSNGSPIPLDNDYIKVHANNSLQILPFLGPLNSSIHRAAYRCVARNSVGKVVSRSVHIKTVKTEDYEEYDVYTQNVWVMRGNTAVFTCDIRPSFVRPFVSVNSWFVGSQKISSGGRYMMMGPTLHLFNVTQQDHLKEMSCLTVNLMSNKSRRSSRPAATLNVIDPVETGPSLEYKMESLVSKSGATVTLPCVTHAFPLASHNWTKNGKTIPPTPRVNASNGYLSISNVSINDSGIYNCNVSNIHGYTTASTHLLVTKSLHVRISPKSQKRDANLPAELKCDIEGGPYSQVVWYKNGSPLTFTQNIRKANDLLLRIESVSRRDIGMYQCLVSSTNDNVQASSQLQLGLSAPVFHNRSDALFKHPEESVSLMCKVYGNPPPTVQWMLAGSPLLPSPNSQRIKVGQYMTAEGDIVSHVNISSLRLTDGGTYACIANNTIGHGQQTAQLNVYGIPTVRRMANHTAVAHKVLKLVCYVSGYPIDRISWLKDGSVLRKDHRISYTTEGVLTISPVAESDEGNYNCSAVNEDGQGSSATVHVSVISEPVLVPLDFPSLTEGEEHIAMCQIKGGDKPIQLSWYRDGQLITPLSFPLIKVEKNTESSSILHFSRVRTTDVANYTCMATNRAGVVNTTAQLATVNVEPYWQTKPDDSEVILGEHIQLPCKGGGVPAPTVVWKKAIDYSSQKFETIANESSSRYELMANGSLMIREATVGDREYYICQISNNVGQDLSQIILLSVNAPVRYTAPTHSQVSLVGKEVKMVCNATGDLPIATAWGRKRRGEAEWEQLNTATMPRINISTTETGSGLISVLTIKSSTRGDDAEYWCTSKNQFGIAHRRIQLTVKEKPAAVTHLTMAEVRSRRISISWMLSDDGNSEITKYIIQCLPADVEWSPSTRRVLISSNTQKVIQGLHPATRYKIRVVAVNAVGESDPSEEITVTTDEESPSAPPRNVTLRPVSSTALNLSWQLPPSDQLNGELVGYRIGYRATNSSDGYSYMDLLSSFHTSFKLVNLDIDMCYAVTIAARNKKGVGPASSSVEAYTFEDVPSSAPTNITTTVNQRTVKVEWTPPHLPYFYGELLGYKVLINPVNLQQDESQQRVKVTRSTDVTFKDLDIYTNYSIQVLTYSPSGDGVRSSPVYVRTPAATPGKPRQVMAAAINSSCVLVSWMDPLRVNGVIQQYKLTVYSGARKVRSVIVTYPNIKRQLLINDLAQGQLYGFTVQAKNFQTEYGVESEETTAKPSPSAAPVFPTVNKTVQVGYHQNLLLPCPAVSDPKPSISWSRKLSDKTLPTRFTVLSNGTIHIKKALKKDSGSYTCTATNKHGATTLTFLLQVQDEDLSYLPSAPVLSVNTTLSSSVQITWISVDNGGFLITGWSVEIREGGRWKDTEIAGSERSYRFTQLTCGQDYDMRVRAINREGSSEYSSAVSVRTLGGKPIAPDDITKVIRAINRTSILLDLSMWSDNGCPISFYSVSYGVTDEERRTLRSPISSSLHVTLLDNLRPGTWYTIDITAHSSAGSTTVSVQNSTLTIDGFTVGPLQQSDRIESMSSGPSTLTLVVPISVVLLAVIIATIGCYFFWRRGRNVLAYKGGNKSRQSMFSDISELNAHHHHARTQFDIPRENLSGDSGVWLLHHPTVSINAEHTDFDKDEVAPEAAEFDSSGKLSTKEASVSPYAMFIYASARSGDYETCTPTLSFARAKLNKHDEERRCIHGALKKHCHYCADERDKLKQLDNSACDACEEEFPPPPPEALHEYHCEPAGKRCTSHEFMRHTGGAVESRPNTTGLRMGRIDTPGRMSQYPSCLSSMATVSSNQEELLLAYHNFKINPPGPILFESPRPLTSSLSPESSIVTEAGIRMFTQSPPKPEESRQAVCEVPIYSTTLPSGCAMDHSSDTATDQEPRQRSNRLKSPQRRFYKRKQKRSRSQRKFRRDASDEFSTNSDDCSPYGIPYHSSSISSTSDKGYGTRNKDTDGSFRAASCHKTRDCGDLYEEEEKMSLVQTALGAGETTPPSSQRNLATDFENENPNSDDSRLIDRYYRTVSTDQTETRTTEPYTEDYTIV